MIINIIHLSSEQVKNLTPKDIETEEIRRQSYLEEMATQRAKFILWDGIIGEPAYKAISLSHKRIVQDAKDKKLPLVVIMEDDAKFVHPDAYKYFLSTFPKKFDLYFGLIYQGEVGENNRLLNGASGILSLYVVNESFYDKFLNLRTDWHLDNVIGEIAFENNFYVCPKTVVTQLDGYSLHHKKEMKYDEYMEGKTLFTGL